VEEAVDMPADVGSCIIIIIISIEKHGELEI
jgi:hypothetical protein